jgi:hypothetical protein
MRVVAEYAMRGRSQALLVAVLGASSLVFSWISAAVIALVTLRQGPREGAFLLAWAALPAGFLLFTFGDIGPLGMIVGTAALAAVLRWSQSWPLALIGASAVGVLCGLGLQIFGSGLLEQLVEQFASLLSDWRGQLTPAEQELVMEAPNAARIAGMLGLINAITCVFCLLLARWWQSALFNPGGFREELHGLRYSPPLSLALLVGLLALGLAGAEYRPWALLCAVPLSVAGLAFVHARAAHRGLGKSWLVIFYLLWLFLDPLKLIVVITAVADSFLDFRSRWIQRRGKKDEDTDE